MPRVKVKPFYGDDGKLEMTKLELDEEAYTEAIKADGGGLRHDKGKNRMELIPPEWEYALADVLTKGSLKYEERNWERGMAWSKPVGCARRHLSKFMMGERYDWETGCHHLAMAAWNLLALMSYDLRGISDIRDLPHAPELMDPAEGVAVLLRVNRNEVN